MAILKFKKLIEDLETGSQQVVTVIGKATSSGYAGTSYMATSAGEAGTTYYATSAGTAGKAGTAAYSSSAGNTGTAYVAHRASSGTAKLAGTHADYATGSEGF